MEKKWKLYWALGLEWLQYSSKENLKSARGQGFHLPVAGTLSFSFGREAAYGQVKNATPTGRVLLVATLTLKQGQTATLSMNKFMTFCCVFGWPGAGRQSNRLECKLKRSMIPNRTRPPIRV